MDLMRIKLFLYFGRLLIILLNALYRPTVSKLGSVSNFKGSAQHPLMFLSWSKCVLFCSDFIN